MRHTFPSSPTRAAAFSVALLSAGTAIAAPLPGTFTGVTKQGQAISVVVNAGSQVTAWTVGYQCPGFSSTTTVNTGSCSVSGEAFACGPTGCSPFVSNSRLAGTFDHDGTRVRGYLTVNHKPDAVSPCCVISNLPWVAVHESVVFDDGFESASVARWSDFTSPGPILEFHLRSQHWAAAGTDALRVEVDGAPVFVLEEGDPDFVSGYRQVRIDLAAHAGTTRALRFEATSYADSTLANFFLDDVAIACASPVGNPVADPSFESGTPNPSWAETSTNFGSPLCSPGTCGFAGARTGSWWAWFGGIDGMLEEGSLTQSAVAIPTCPATP